jgi:hypothetical protein
MSEFSRQVETLVEKGLPAMGAIGEAELRERLAPLAELEPREPFAIVAGAGLFDPARVIGAVSLRGKPGFTDMEPDDLARFEPIDGVEVPAGFAYLVEGWDAGADTLNVTPDAALPAIEAAGRSPLTIDEGLAIVLQHPEVLRERNRFSLLGSRCGDRRVTALWIKRGGRPRLGWCYAGAPHTWLGSASCAGRLGIAGRPALPDPGDERRVCRPQTTKSDSRRRNWGARTRT